LGVLERVAKTRSIKYGLVFFSNCGAKLNNCNLIRGFKRAVKKTGISDFTWHGLRRTFATRLAHKGLDIYKIPAFQAIRMFRQLKKDMPITVLKDWGLELKFWMLTTFGKKRVF
jgi:integrase